MKRIVFVLLFLSALRCAAFAAEDVYVRLAIKGANVNLRPEPRSAGKALGQTNTGDVFIAESWPIVCNADKSKWYKIVLAYDAKSDKISVLSERGSRFRKGAAYVSANFVTVLPLEKDDAEKISALTPYRYTLDADPRTGKFSGANRNYRFFSAKRSIKKDADIYDRDVTSVDGAKVIGQYKKGAKVKLLGTNSDETVYLALDFEYIYDQPFGWIKADSVDKVGAGNGSIDWLDFIDFELARLFIGGDVNGIVRKWGDFEVERFASEWINDIYFIFTRMKAPGIRVTFYDDFDYDRPSSGYYLQEFSIERKGAGIGGIYIGADWCGKEHVEKQFGKPHRIEELEAGGVSWNWEDELNDFGVNFGADGLVRSIHIQRRAAD